MEKRIVVTDRSNNRLQFLDMEGNHLKTVGGYLLPANIDVLEDLLMVPELQARITLLGPDDEIVARLGMTRNTARRRWLIRKRCAPSPILGRTVASFTLMTRVSTRKETSLLLNGCRPGGSQN